MLQAIADNLRKAIQAPATVETSVEMAVDRGQSTPALVLAALGRQPELTLAEVALQIGRSLRTIERVAAKLKTEGKLRHLGPRKGGRWQVVGRK